MKNKMMILFLCLLLPSIFCISKGIERIRIILQNRAVSSVAPRIMEELTPSGMVSIDASRNALSISDESAVVDKIQRMISELDVPARKFAISSTLFVYSNKPQSVFKQDNKLIDVADFLNTSDASEKYEGIVDIKEGDKGEIDFKQSPYSLSIELGGFDPWERKIRFENISLKKKSENSKVTIFSAKANLKEGVETVISIQAKSPHPPFRLNLNPTILPEIKIEKEHP